MFTGLNDFNTLRAEASANSSNGEEDWQVPDDLSPQEEIAIIERGISEFEAEMIEIEQCGLECETTRMPCVAHKVSLIF